MTGAYVALTPAERLQGVRLPGGWEVVARAEAEAEGGGGTFSVCWIVERAGSRAFLKAIDLRRALRRSPDKPMQALERVARAYNHELDLLTACAGRGMNRIVRALDHGEYQVDPGEELSAVFYLIFEIAIGDLRDVLDPGGGVDVARNLTALHDVAVGISQLHGAEIAHQDLKPANLLVYSEELEAVRLADLGRASRRAGSMPHDKLPFAGARYHAPPEGLYGAGPPDWSGRRACDLYHLGSILLYLFCGVSATAGWVGRLDPQLRPRRLGGPFDGSYEEALPYVRQALQEVCEAFVPLADERLRNELIARFRELCDPDPKLRGHPRARRGHADRLSVERYIAFFDLQAKRAAYLSKAA